MGMLEDLVQTMYASREVDGDPLEAAAAFLQRYEGRAVHKVRPQYVRMRVCDLQSVGCTRANMAKILGISERYVYRILKESEESVQ